jgi:predicted Zn-dependent protease with MMP-like domain
MNLARDWYFIQAGPLDARAKKLPLPDDLMGRLVEYVIAHEVGHTLGFQHNMKASATYPVEKVRDAQWLKTMSHTPTLMDYSRFNYVAQPEDNIPPEELIPQIGPYDKWATMWGYKPIPGAKTPDDEKKTLDEWAREQDAKPYLRFSTADARGSDPGENTEAVGDADAIVATGLGIKNLKRVADMLLPATSRPGEPYDDLEELYGRMLGQWAIELNHVAAIVGGFNSQQKHAGQNGVRFIIVPKEHQAAAVRFLNENAFATPSWAVKADILRRIEAAGALARVNQAQERVLNSLLSNARFDRLVEQEAIDGMAAYKPADFMADVRRGIWSELEGAGPVRIDVYRRNLQNSYIDLLSNKLNVRPSVTDARDQIAKALDPKFAPPAAPATFTFPFGIDDESSSSTCWPDYAVRIRPREEY